MSAFLLLAALVTAALLIYTVGVWVGAHWTCDLDRCTARKPRTCPFTRDARKAVGRWS